MRAGKHQFSTDQIITPGSPLNQIAQILSSKISLKEISLYENSYVFNWVRSQLSSPMGAIDLNPQLVPDGIPIVDKDAYSRLVLYYQGNCPEALTAVNLLLES